uniref:hypothetical protein n=1 Tax=uncultured Sphingomonas sp. TaxID=158754 RepID=UPI0025CDD8E2|nr:hypothetical protein [uncultured Sphingomonas sp.]
MENFLGEPRHGPVARPITPLWGASLKADIAGRGGKSTIAASNLAVTDDFEREDAKKRRKGAKRLLKLRAFLFPFAPSR